MRKLILSILIIAFGFISYAQNNSIFDKFEDYDDVTTVVVTKKAFQMLKKISNDSKEGREFNALVSGLKDLKVFTTDNAKIAKEMQATFTKHIKNAKLSELMRVKDKDANVKIYIREGKDAMGGSYHPAFRQLVESEIVKDILEKIKIKNYSSVLPMKLMNLSVSLLV